MRLDRPAQHRVVCGQRRRPCVGVRLPPTGRPLDIGGQKRHHPRRSSRHGHPRRISHRHAKLTWAPGSIDTILAGGESKELAPTLERPTGPTAPTRGYALRPSNPYALSQASTEDLLLELRRRIVAPRSRRHDPWGDGDDGLNPDGDDWPEEG